MLPVTPGEADSLNASPGEMPTRSHLTCRTHSTQLGSMHSAATTQASVTDLLSPFKAIRLDEAYEVARGRFLFDLHDHAISVGVESCRSICQRIIIVAHTFEFWGDVWTYRSSCLQY